MQINEFTQNSIEFFKKLPPEFFSAKEIYRNNDLSIEDVYIPISFEYLNTKIKTDIEREEYKKIKNHVGWPDFVYETAPRITSFSTYVINEELKKGNRIAIVGESGSGKTFFCKRLALALLNNETDYFAKHKSENGFVFKPNIIPFYINCRDIVKYDPSLLNGRRNDVKALAIFYAGIRNSYANLSFSDFLDIFHTVSVDNILLIFDNWEALINYPLEVGNKSREKSALFLGIIRSFLENNQKINCIISSLYLVEESTSKIFHPLEIYKIKDLSGQEIKDYCETSAVAVSLSGDGRNSLADEILSSDRKCIKNYRRTISDLQKLLCHYKEYYRLPKTEFEIIKEYVDKKIDQAVKRYKTNRQEIEICFSYLAFNLFMDNTLIVGRVEYYLESIGNSRSSIERRIRNAIIESQEIVHSWKNVVDTQDDRKLNELITELKQIMFNSGLLVIYSSNNCYRFENRSVADYFMALALFKDYLPESYHRVFETEDGCLLSGFTKAAYNKRDFERVLLYLFQLEVDNKKNMETITNTLLNQKNKVSAYLLLKAVWNGAVFSQKRLKIIYDAVLPKWLLDERVYDYLSFEGTKDNPLACSIMSYIDNTTEENYRFLFDNVGLLSRLSELFAFAGDEDTAELFCELAYNTWVSEGSSDYKYMYFIGERYRKAEKDNEALMIFQDILAQNEQSIGEKDEITKRTVFSVVLIYEKRGEYTLAVDAMKLYWSEYKYAATDKTSVSMYRNLTDLAHFSGDYRLELIILGKEYEKSLKDQIMDKERRETLVCRMENCLNQPSLNWKESSFYSFYESNISTIISSDSGDYNKIEDFRRIAYAAKDYQRVLSLDQKLFSLAEEEFLKNHKYDSLGRFQASQNYLVESYTNTGEIGMAEKLCKKILSNYGDNVDALMNLSEIYIKKGKNWKAHAIYRKIIREELWKKSIGKKSVDKKDVLIKLAGLYEKLNYEGEARIYYSNANYEIYEKCGAYSPEQIDILAKKADDYFKRGEDWWCNAKTRTLLNGKKINIKKEYMKAAWRTEYVAYEFCRREFGENAVKTIESKEKLITIKSLWEKHSQDVIKESEFVFDNSEKTAAGKIKEIFEEHICKRIKEERRCYNRLKEETDFKRIPLIIEDIKDDINWSKRNKIREKEQKKNKK